MVQGGAFNKTIAPGAGSEVEFSTFHLVKLVLYLYIYTPQVLLSLMYISPPLKLFISLHLLDVFLTQSLGKEQLR